MDGWMAGWIDGWMDGWIAVRRPPSPSSYTNILIIKAPAAPGWGKG